jgi:anti-anti-sigma factor
VTELELIESRSGPVRIVSVVGELDLATTPAFAEALERLAGESQDPLVVDLSSCAFIDSTGIAALVHGAEPYRERDSDFAVVCGQGTPREVLRITAIDQAVPVFESLDEAVARAGSR